MTKKVLVGLNTALIPVLAVLTNLISSNFPSFSGPTLWIIAASILGLAIIISVTVTLLEDKKEGAQGAPALQQTTATKKTFSLRKNKSKTPPVTLKSISSTATSPVSATKTVGIINNQPTIDHPLLISLAIDVSNSMKSPIIDKTGKAIQRWTSVTDALEHFAYLGAAWFKDPETQHVLPYYSLMAYGFGFTERSYQLGMRKKPGGEVRDLLQHPSHTSLPSALEISEHWRDYRDNLLRAKNYTGDLFGRSPMCQALKTIQKRIVQEKARSSFSDTILLLIISDGLSSDGDPLPIIEELHSMNVITLCCYLADQDVLAAKKLYAIEDPNWSEGARSLFHCSSPLERNNGVSSAIFDYLSNVGWNPYDGARLFAQINQTDGLNTFLEILLSGALSERMG